MCQFCDKGHDDGMPCFCPDQFEEHRIDWESSRPESVVVWMLAACAVFWAVVCFFFIAWVAL